MGPVADKVDGLCHGAPSVSFCKNNLKVSPLISTKIIAACIRSIYATTPDRSILSLTVGALKQEDDASIAAQISVTELIEAGAVGATIVYAEKTNNQANFIGIGPKLDLLILDSYDTGEWASLLGVFSFGIGIKGLQNDVFGLLGLKLELGTLSHMSLQYLMSSPMSSDNPSATTKLAGTKGAMFGFGFDF